MNVTISPSPESRAADTSLIRVTPSALGRRGERRVADLAGEAP